MSLFFSIKNFKLKRYFFGAVLLAVGFGVPARAAIHYEVSLAHPEQHLFHVKMQIPDAGGELTVQMPAWNTLYEIRDFSAHVLQVKASSDSGPVTIEKKDKMTWRIAARGTVTVEYSTYWDDGGPFAAQLNDEHAFINPAMILLYVVDRRGEEAQLELRDVPQDWQAASADQRAPSGPQQFAFDAPSYDALADAPIEAGKFERFSVPGISPPIDVVLHGDPKKKKQIQDELHRICAYELRLMDGAPFPHYTFLVHLGNTAEDGGGGMEHSNSTAIAAHSEGEFVNVAAHEFFHLWNVKRIRPATLEPVDYTREQYTRALWFAEGVTSTYASYTLVRSGVWEKALFYEDLSAQISQLERSPANRWQSAEQSSLDTWLDKYSLYNRPENSISYYTKGQVLGVLLDILIRDRTNNEKSLDDVMRRMNEEFAKKGKFYRDSLDVRLTAENVAGSSFEDFFAKYVAGAEAFPYEHVLSLGGLTLQQTESRRSTLGFYADRDSSGTLVVKSVDSTSPAAQAGVHAGDVISLWNGAEPPRRLDRWVGGQKPGDHLRLTVSREGKNLDLEFPLGEVRETNYLVTDLPRATEKEKRIREGLLHGTTQPVTAFVK